MFPRQVGVAVPVLSALLQHGVVREPTQISKPKTLSDAQSEANVAPGMDEALPLWAESVEEDVVMLSTLAQSGYLRYFDQSRGRERHPLSPDPCLPLLSLNLRVRRFVSKEVGEALQRPEFRSYKVVFIRNMCDIRELEDAIFSFRCRGF